MSRNDSYRGGSTTFHIGSAWTAKDKSVDAETVFRWEREAEALAKLNREWLAETAPNQDPKAQRDRIGVRSREILQKKRLERLTQKQKGGKKDA